MALRLLFLRPMKLPHMKLRRIKFAKSHLSTLLFSMMALGMMVTPRAVNALEQLPLMPQGKRLNGSGGAVRPKIRISEEAKTRLNATIVHHTLSIVYSRTNCDDRTPEACLDHLATLDAEYHPQFAQVSLEKWDAANQEISLAIQRLKDSAVSATSKMLNEKAEVWRMLFNASILVRLGVGKYQEQVMNNQEVKVPGTLRDLNQKGLQRLDLHHQLAFLGPKIYIGHKAVDRSHPEAKAHRLIAQLPLEEIVVPDPNDLSAKVVEKIEASTIRFGQALSK